MTVSDERMNYIVRETAEWAQRVMSAGEVGLPGLIEIVSAHILAAAEVASPGILKTGEGEKFVVRLLSPMAAQLAGFGMTGEKISAVFSAVAIGVLINGPETRGAIEVVDATAFGVAADRGEN